MKALAEECRKAGIKFGFYYSHAFDWGDSNAPGNDWEILNPGGDKLLGGSKWWASPEQSKFIEKARRYVDEKAIPQTLELLRQYRPDILWFDTPHKLPIEENLRIFAAIRKEDPRVVINGRIFPGGYPAIAPLRDYQNTGDRAMEFVPYAGDWEAIPTIGESYGYNKNDVNQKPPGYFVTRLAKAVSRGGNLLLNVGPLGDGSFDPTEAKVLAGIGDWWKVQGESIKGCTRSPLPVQSWGEVTRKGSVLYLHVLQWPRDGKLLLGNLNGGIESATALLDGAAIPVSRDGSFSVLDLGKASRHPDDTVIKVKTSGEIRSTGGHFLLPNVAENVFHVYDGEKSPNLKYEDGKTNFDRVVSWKDAKAQVRWKASRSSAKQRYRLVVCYDAPAPSAARTTQGDVNREILQKTAGAAGTYEILVGEGVKRSEVVTGQGVTQDLGEILPPVLDFTIEARAVKITGDELFRLRSVKFLPLDD